MIDIYVISLFSDEIRPFFLKGIFLKAYQKKSFNIQFIDLRAFAWDKHHKVDDHPFGKRVGMLLKADVLYRAITSIDHYEDYTILYPDPAGKAWGQAQCDDMAQKQSLKLIVICGYYEGVDDRIFSLLPIQKISLGSFVLTSGELPTLMILDSVLRCVPGILGNAASIQDESWRHGGLEYPQFTQPRSVEGVDVPEVLLSGHHQAIQTWQKNKSLEKTLFRAPSLLKDKDFNDADKQKVVEIFLK